MARIALLKISTVEYVVLEWDNTSARLDQQIEIAAQAYVGDDWLATERYKTVRELLSQTAWVGEYGKIGYRSTPEVDREDTLDAELD